MLPNCLYTNLSLLNMLPMAYSAYFHRPLNSSHISRLTFWQLGRIGSWPSFHKMFWGIEIFYNCYHCCTFAPGAVKDRWAAVVKEFPPNHLVPGSGSFSIRQVVSIFNIIFKLVIPSKALTVQLFHQKVLFPFNTLVVNLISVKKHNEIVFEFEGANCHVEQNKIFDERIALSNVDILISLQWKSL